MKEMNFYTKYLILLLFISFLIIHSASAQESGTRNLVYGGVGYFMAGYSVVDLDNLNQSLSNSGIPELDRGSITIGGGGHYIIKNIIIGGEGHGVTGKNAENDNYKSAYSAGYGFFNLGYVILNSPSFNFYPLIGFGGGGMTVSILDKSKLTNSFDDILDDPARESYLTKGGFLMNFSLGADYFFVGEKSESTTGGFLIGIKAGYILDVSNNDWDFNGQHLNNSPGSGVSGPYVRITFGGGGLTRNK